MVSNYKRLCVLRLAFINFSKQIQGFQSMSQSPFMTSFKRQNRTNIQMYPTRIAYLTSPTRCQFKLSQSLFKLTLLFVIQSKIIVSNSQNLVFYLISQTLSSLQGFLQIRKRILKILNPQ